MEWWSLMPVLVAVVLAIVTKRIGVSLLFSIGTGITLLMLQNMYSEKSITVFEIEKLFSRDHILIVLFAVFVSITITFITTTGGIQSLLIKLENRIKTRKKAQFWVWLMGLTVFFDDYANSLIVGNTMRPITDKNGVSREKLAYIVDSTAAPIAAIAIVSTWVAVEMSYIQTAPFSKELSSLDQTVFTVFINSLKYSYYPILTLFFILVMVQSGRDFGPMYKAEIAAKKVESPNSLHGLPPIYIATIPIVCLVAVSLALVFLTGWINFPIGEEKVYGVSLLLKNADVVGSLLIGSIVSVCSAFIFYLRYKSRTQLSVVNSLKNSLKEILPAIYVLALTWGLAQVIENCGTGNFIASALKTSFIRIEYLPLIIFILSGVISFSTGTSWGAMAIVYPISFAIFWSLCQNHNLQLESNLPILYQITAAVLAGAVFGDHCSPISDTTVLSSTACQCSHLAHVKTQMPYAISVSIISCVCYLSTALMSLQWYWSMLLGGILVFMLLYLFGKRVME